ncbi:hypothetical protein TSUD_177150 [Trifolium subterraneum]|uniref:F-box domain-containing protein n=1 Tax=Trifolium subterraneum TaxID=3900 RepID=A0A2Z6PCA6_TRISU|nr:hypothetical protein TSUD_177150 [Trifolium subterraneum]
MNFEMYIEEEKSNIEFWMMVVVGGDDGIVEDDCWLSICTFLMDDDGNHRYLKPLSLVSKQLLSITNRHRYSFTICTPTLLYLQTLCHRFPNLTSIHITEFHLQQNTGSHSVQDGVKAMLMALPKLRKINLYNSYGYYFNVNDSILLNLCKNCEFLEDIVMFNCPLLTQDGIASAIRERPSLMSLSINLPSNGIPNNISSHFIDSLVSLKGLTCLDLSYSQISDKLLSSIAREDLLLRRLVFQYCTGYSYSGLVSLLSKCQRIQHLDLRKANFLNDQHVVQLSLFIDNLMSINLGECNMLTKLALFALVRECPLLSEIKMDRIESESVENSDSSMDFGVYPRLKSLYLAYNSWLSDEVINTFASIFPNLQLLDLNSCDISEEVLTLEVLSLSNSGIDDSSLYMISKSCSGLLQLDLTNCLDVTEKGVMQVVANCTQLREIYLQGCSKVAADVDSMVYIRPSLRKITTPNFSSSQSRMKAFLCRGCLVV